MPDSGKISWAEFSAGKDPGFFSTRAGQVFFESSHGKERISDLPIAWSLPPALGPWPEDEEGIVVRILSFLPKCNAAAIGDFLRGLWTQRSEIYRPKGAEILEKLLKKGMVTRSEGPLGEEWCAVSPVAQPLALTGPLAPPIRFFSDRLRLAILDATSRKRLEAKRDEDMKQLQRLEAVPENERDAAWQEEVSMFRELAEMWKRPGNS